jgi:hypothetical protein
MYPHPKIKNRWHCRKCSVNTSEINEYYSLRPEVWNSVIDRWKISKDKDGQAGMICIRCFESLLGRPLITRDFSDCPLNHSNFSCGSPLLRRRLRSELPFWDDWPSFGR